MQTIHSYKLIVLTVAALLARGTFAGAADSKTIPASSCLSTDPTQQFAQRGGAPINVLMPGVPVICPFQRDNTVNTNGLYDLEVRLWRSPWGSTAPTSCTAESVYVPLSGKSPGIPIVLKSVVKSTTSSDYQTLDWGTSLNVSNTESTFSVRCTLRTDYDELQSLFWSERDVTESNPPKGLGDIKRYPGSSCVGTSYEGLPIVRDASGISMAEGNAGLVDILCPILHDNLSKVATDIRVRIHKTTWGDGSEECSYQMLGTTPGTYEPVDGSDVDFPVAPGDYELSLPTTAGRIPDSLMGLQCNLAPGTKLISYSYAEPTGE